MALFTLFLGERCLHFIHLIPTCPNETFCLRPGRGAETSSSLAMNASTLWRTKQWIGLRACSSAGVASRQRSVVVELLLWKALLVTAGSFLGEIS